MVKALKIELCDECRYDGGQHFADDGTVTRPHLAQAKQVAEARQLSAEANEAAMNAGRLIIRDVAATHHEFSANHIRHLFDDANIPDPVIGAVFSWAAGKKATADGPLIEATGRFEPSSEKHVRHRIAIWRSRCYRGRQVA